MKIRATIFQTSLGMGLPIYIDDEIMLDAIDHTTLMLKTGSNFTIYPDNTVDEAFRKTILAIKKSYDAFSTPLKSAVQFNNRIDSLIAHVGFLFEPITYLHIETLEDLNNIIKLRTWLEIDTQLKNGTTPEGHKTIAFYPALSDELKELLDGTTKQNRETPQESEPVGTP